MRLILSVSLALVAAAASAAEVYMAVAPDGTVTYSDRPTDPNAKPIGVTFVPPSGSSSGPAESPDSGDSGADGAEPASAEPAAQASAEERERNCEVARERVARYANARRLFRELPNGEREYLDDQEIDEVRAKAAADVETWCS